MDLSFHKIYPELHLHIIQKSLAALSSFKKDSKEFTDRFKKATEKIKELGLVLKNLPSMKELTSDFTLLSGLAESCDSKNYQETNSNLCHNVMKDILRVRQDLRTEIQPKDSELLTMELPGADSWSRDTEYSVTSDVMFLLNHSPVLEEATLSLLAKLMQNPQIATNLQGMLEWHFRKPEVSVHDKVQLMHLMQEVDAFKIFYCSKHSLQKEILASMNDYTLRTICKTVRDATLAFERTTHFTYSNTREYDAFYLTLIKTLIPYSMPVAVHFAEKMSTDEQKKIGFFACVDRAVQVPFDADACVKCYELIPKAYRPYYFRKVLKALIENFKTAEALQFCAKYLENSGLPQIKKDLASYFHANASARSLYLWTEFLIKWHEHIQAIFTEPKTRLPEVFPCYVFLEREIYMNLMCYRQELDDRRKIDLIESKIGLQLVEIFKTHELGACRFLKTHEVHSMKNILRHIARYYHAVHIDLNIDTYKWTTYLRTEAEVSEDIESFFAEFIKHDVKMCDVVSFNEVISCFSPEKPFHDLIQVIFENLYKYFHYMKKIDEVALNVELHKKFLEILNKLRPYKKILSGIKKDLKNRFEESGDKKVSEYLEFIMEEFSS